jgi:hypothetical protein
VGSTGTRSVRRNRDADLGEPQLGRAQRLRELGEHVERV